MQYTRFGNTGLRTSRLALGTMTFGLQTDEAESIRILDRATDAGINLIDTADVYPLGGEASTAGGTEAIVGRWLKGKRSRYIVATKAVGKVGPNAWDQGSSRKHLVEAAEASLRRLQTDYIDLYQLHWDDAETPLDESLETLDTLVRSGKVRYLGISNVLAYRLALSLGKQAARKWHSFVSVQPRYNLLYREPEREILPLARETGLAVIPYNPLAGGLLTGKHKPGAPPEGTRFTLGTAGSRYQDRYWHNREFETVKALAAAAAEAGIAFATASLAWVLAHPDVTAPIIGASRAGQLDASLAAADLKWDPALKARFDQLTSEYRRGDSTR
jgi:aryl-alcohol dehydrogenase-like predicted oxidoreductase